MGAFRQSLSECFLPLGLVRRSELSTRTGKAIGIDQAVDVKSRFAQEPGDATLTPNTMATNEEDQATLSRSHRNGQREYSLRRDPIVFSGRAEVEREPDSAELTETCILVIEDLEVDESGDPKIEIVTITVSGPNGDLEVVLTPEPTSSGGGGQASSSSLTPTPGATVHLAPSGGVVIRASEEK